MIIVFIEIEIELLFMCLIHVHIIFFFRVLSHRFKTSIVQPFFSLSISFGRDSSLEALHIIVIH